MSAVRPATKDDIKRVVAIHMSAFPGFFLTRLGPGFLRRYYRLVLDYSHGILMIAEDEGAPVGFVAGFVRPSEFYALLRRRKLELAFSVLPAVLRRPWLAPRLVANFRRSGRVRVEGEATAAELASVAVDPEHAGRGLGWVLVKSFLDASRELGAHVAYLTTDALDNEPVNRFYRRLGFELRRTFTAPANRLMNEYRLALTKDPGQ